MTPVPGIQCLLLASLDTRDKCGNKESKNTPIHTKSFSGKALKAEKNKDTKLLVTHVNGKLYRMCKALGDTVGNPLLAGCPALALSRGLSASAFPALVLWVCTLQGKGQDTVACA